MTTPAPGTPPQYLPPAGVPTGASLVLDYLALEKVDTIFGVPGGGLIALMYELQLRSDAVQFVISRHESGAVFEAEGYALARGHLGAAMVTSGPGALNALTGFVNCLESHTPVLLMSGELSQQMAGHGYLQEGLGADLDLPGVFKATSAFSAWCTNLPNLREQLEHALRSIMSGPSSAAQLTLPNDVLNLPLPAGLAAPGRVEAYRPVLAGSAPSAEVHAIHHNLISEQRPLIMLGNGCRRALRQTVTSADGSRSMTRLDRLLAYCETYAIPVMTTPDAKGIFPESHACSLRHYGKASCPWPLAYMQPSYDSLLVLGASLHDLDTEHWAPAMVPKTHFMQVDLSSAVIGRGFPITLGVVADVASLIDMLCESGASYSRSTGEDSAIQQRRKVIADIRATTPFRYADTMVLETAPAAPQAIMRAMSELTPAESHVFIDSGNCVGWGSHYLTVNPVEYHGPHDGAFNGHLHQALQMAPMGWATAAVVGSKVGAPSASCVAIVGDGAFMMHGNEVATAAAHGIGAIWVVMQNDDLGMIGQGMYLLAQSAYGGNQEFWENCYTLGNPDLAMFARGLGANAVTVHSPAEFRAAYTAALTAAGGTGEPAKISGRPTWGGCPQVIVVKSDSRQIPPLYPPALYPPGRE